MKLLLKTIVTVVILITVSAMAHSKDIVFLTRGSEKQTYIDENGELRGIKHGGRRAFNVELIRQMMIILDHPRKIKIYPFKRALLTVQNEPGYALFNVNKTADRESTVQWVGPLQSSTSYFYEAKNAPTGIRTLDDAKKVETICVLRGNVHHTRLKKMGFTNLWLNNSYEGCYEMLIANRVDLTPSSDIAAATREGSQFFSGIKRTPVVISKAEGFLVFSTDIPEQEVMKWQEVLNSLKSSGRYDELIKQYLHEKQ